MDPLILPGLPDRAAVRAALRRLGVERLVFGLHTAALPAAAGEETGRGSLASRGGMEVLRLVHALGFDGVQLGPGGMTTRANPSPYDGTAFSRDVLAIDLVALVEDPTWHGLLPPRKLAALIDSLPATAAERVPYATVYDGHLRALDAAWRELGRRGDELADLDRRRRAFVADESAWLEGDALFAALTAEHGTDDWTAWPALDRQLWDPPPEEAAAAARRRREVADRHRDVVARWGFCQWLAQEHRDVARRRLHDLGLALYGDLQVGLSPRDAWRHRGLFLPGYFLGAPPSRTNPRGQPWGYPVYRPDQVFADGCPPARWGHSGDVAAGPVLRFLAARFRRAFAHYDALRIDHPHGLVCPWVYRADASDPYTAVQTGARLYSSPALADHPQLAACAIACRDQVDERLPRWHDHRVHDLDTEQVAAYGTVLAAAVAAAEAAGRSPRDLVCEVLSTLPEPLGRVLELHGLGRFRVTQKADLARPDDVYRSENARREDWVMLGNHDTPPIWAVLERWQASGELPARADHVAARLASDPARREALARRFREEPSFLAQGMLAELFASPAANVFVFMSDFFGLREPYNRPGEIHPDNWTARLPRDPTPTWSHRATHGQALDIATACALALRARGGDEDLAARLDSSHLEPITR